LQGESPIPRKIQGGIFLGQAQGTVFLFLAKQYRAMEGGLAEGIFPGDLRRHGAPVVPRSGMSRIGEGRNGGDAGHGRSS